MIYFRAATDKEITIDFLSRERKEQLKRETASIVTKVKSVLTDVKAITDVKEAISSEVIPKKAAVSIQATKVETSSSETKTVTEEQPQKKMKSDVTRKVTSAIEKPTKSETIVTETVVTEVEKPIEFSTTHDQSSTFVYPTKVETVVTKTKILSGNKFDDKIPASVIEPVVKKEKPSVEFSTKVIETTYTVTSKEEPTTSEVTRIVKDHTSTEEYTETRSQKRVSDSKFDVSKIRTDTLGKFDFEDITEHTKDHNKFIPKDLGLKETPEITKEQVQPVIDDILQRGSIAAAARTPVIEKDIKLISIDMVETEKRSYDAKVPVKDERRHSCISPAISLERIAESEAESDVEDEPPKHTPIVAEKEREKTPEVSPAIKKSDSAMKQMADNIEIIIKQASEEVDVSSEEHIVEEPEPQDISGRVSVDSIIEEAVTTVESYLDQKEDDIASKKEMMYEETRRFMKDRPGLTKSLSRDSGEIVIMPKKKHARTFSVQSSPEEVEEQIYTDSESGITHKLN